MKREVGLWIDHFRTVMVTVVNEKDETLEIRSNVEKRAKPSPGSKVKDPNRIVPPAAEGGIDPRHKNHLSGYYDGVVSMLRNADSILIFGPGEAKIELRERLVRENLGERIVGLENVNKMTDHQITAKVRDHYLGFQNY
jgi:hypothetical protein